MSFPSRTGRSGWTSTEPPHPARPLELARQPLDRSGRAWLGPFLWCQFVVLTVILGALVTSVVAPQLNRPIGASASPGGTSHPPLTNFPYIQHAVVIVLENRELSDVYALGTYERYLQTINGNATNFYALCHGSPPNYLAMTGGRSTYCGQDVSGGVETTNLPDVIEHAGLSWAGYFESMPSACYAYSKGAYVTWHNPFLSYGDIIDSPTRCATHVLPSERFNSSVAAGVLPTVSFYVPNAINDCDNSSLTFCDGWLKSFLSPLLNSTQPAVHALISHTAFFVTYDEGITNRGYVSSVVTSWCLTATGKALASCGGHIYLTVVSPYSAGLSYTSDATMYNLESTLEWLFGLGSDGGYDGTADFPPMTSLFSFPSNTG